MKKKIQDALEQAYAVKLGLTDKKVYARVAALGETYVANEEDIPAFVEKAEDILKGFQGMSDQGRTLATANARIAELEEKLKKLESPDDDPDNGDKGDKDKKDDTDLAKTIAEAVAAAVKPIQESFDAYKAQTSAKEAKGLARDTFFANKWTTKYKDEAEDAWERASELNEAKGGNMTAEELSGKATEYFNKLVKRKGDDATKPFEAESDQQGNYDFSGIAKHLESTGKLQPESSN